MTTDSRLDRPAETRVSATRAVPLYFGPTDRPLFGWYHPPEGPDLNLRAVLCPPLGYEGLFAHPTLKAMAEALARRGIAVVRFDLDGTGDSAGSDSDPDRVERWIGSVTQADAECRRLAGDRPSLLIGMRAGALLSTEAASRLGHVEGLVLWAPVMRGKAFMREQKAFANMAVATAATSDRPTVEGGIEAYGYYFSDETIQAFGALDLRQIDEPPARRTLLLWRDDVEDRRGDLEQWCDRPDVVEDQAAGYAKMMEPPISMELPERAIESICAFAEGLVPETESSVPSSPLPEVVTEARVAPNAVERAVWYDEEANLFGILTTPDNVAPRRVLILLNNASGYRVGPHALNPPLARRLAEEGIATFRIDLGGVGDSRLPHGREPHHVYGLDCVDDVRHATEFARSMGIEEVYLGGLCSGAFLAWHAGRALEGVAGLSLWNLQIFEWSDDLSLDVSPLDLQYETDHYRQSLRSGKSWKKLLSGQVDVRYALGVGFRFIGYRVESMIQRLRSSVSFLAARTEIGSALEDFHAAGTRVSFIFADRDPGLANLRTEVSAEWKRLVRDGRMSVGVVEGSDHSFTPGWASQELYDLVREFLAR